MHNRLVKADKLMDLYFFLKFPSTFAHACDKVIYAFNQFCLVSKLFSIRKTRYLEILLVSGICI